MERRDVIKNLSALPLAGAMYPIESALDSQPQRGTSTTQSQGIDILLKGGHVIDPKNQIDGRMDVAIAGDKIVQVARDIPARDARRVIDVAGYYVTPGLIDMHVHAFSSETPSSSLLIDGFTFRAGVTTAVDAGSAGWRNFREKKAEYIDTARTRILAFLNITGGKAGRFEAQNVDDMNPDMCAYMITRLFPNILVGVKSAHYWGDFTSVDQAVKAGNLANVPVMVDFGEHIPPNSIEELFMRRLRPGDIYTHTYADHPNNRECVITGTSADQNRRVKPFIFEAQKRGIIFETGHGAGAFQFSCAIPSIQQGFITDVISTDLYSLSMNQGCKDMANLLSKYMAMGLSLQDVITRATLNPANVIKRPELGNLSVGSEADIAVFTLRTGNFGFLDVRAQRIDGTQKLEAELTIRAGRIVWDLNGIASQR